MLGYKVNEKTLQEYPEIKKQLWEFSHVDEIIDWAIQRTVETVEGEVKSILNTSIAIGVKLDFPYLRFLKFLEELSPRKSLRTYRRWDLDKNVP